MKPKTFFYILSAVTLAAVVAGGYWFFKSSNSLSASTQTLGRSLADVQVANEKTLQLQNLKRTYDDTVSPLMPNLQQALPNSKQQGLASRMLRNLANGSGVTISSLSFDISVHPSPTSQTKAATGVLAMPVKFTIDGSYSHFQSFLQGLENFGRQSDVTKIQIAKSSGNSISADVEVNLFLKP